MHEILVFLKLFIVLIHMKWYVDEDISDSKWKLKLT